MLLDLAHKTHRQTPWSCPGKENLSKGEKAFFLRRSSGTDFLSESGKGDLYVADLYVAFLYTNNLFQQWLKRTGKKILNIWNTWIPMNCHSFSTWYLCPFLKYYSLSLYKTLHTRTPSFFWKARDEDPLLHWNLLLHRTWQIQAPAIYKGVASAPLTPSAWKFWTSIKASDKTDEIFFLDAEQQAFCMLSYVSKAPDSSLSTTLLFVSFHFLTHAALLFP